MYRLGHMTKFLFIFATTHAHMKKKYGFEILIKLFFFCFVITQILNNTSSPQFLLFNFLKFQIDISFHVDVTSCYKN